LNTLQKTMAVLASTAATGLLSYEAVCKSDVWLGAPLPGWYEARTAEIRTPYVPLTGLIHVDRLIHEGQEAAAYYSFLLRPGPRAASRASRSPRISR
jgi:hypothetical protein